MSKFLAAMAVVVALVGLSACGSSSSDSSEGSTSAGTTASAAEPVRVAVVLPGLDNPFWRDVKAGAEQVNGPGVEVAVNAPPSQAQVQPMLDLIQAEATKGVEAVAVVPYDPNVFGPALRRLEAAGIPIVGLGYDSVGDVRLAGALKFDQDGATTAAMRTMIEQLGDRGDVALLTNPGNADIETRLAAATRALDASNVRIAADAPMDCQLRGLNAAEDVLQKESQIAGMFVPCGTAAVYAARAFARAGRATDDYVLWGYDGTPDELAAIKDGRMDGTVRFDGIAVGKALAEETVKAARGESLGTTASTEYDIVTKDNVNEFIEQR